MEGTSSENDTIANQEGNEQKPPEKDFPPGFSLDRYMIIETLGRGGMGAVYSAFDPKLGRRIALKVVAVSELTEELKAAKQNRMLREAQAMAQLSHPNVAAVFDVGTIGDSVFIAMEYIEGETLRKWLSQKKPSEREIVAAYLKAGEGLAAAHRVGLVHRDFKPDNVMLSSDGQVKVLDFGLAREIGAQDSVQKSPEENEESPADSLAPGESGAPRDSGAPPDSRPPDDSSVSSTTSERLLRAQLTRVGDVVGTPAYMSPEQLRGTQVDAKSDQFGFCVSLFEALSGKRPFEGSTVTLLLQSIHNRKKLSSIDCQHIPRHLLQAILKGMSADPDNRFADMSSLLTALRDDQRRRLRDRRIRVLQGTAASIAACLLLVLWWADRTRLVAQCTQVGTRLTQIWNDDVKRTIQGAFVGASAAMGPQIWERADKTLSRYADAWRDMSVQTCEATRIHAHQSERVMDLRMACLDRKADELWAISVLFSKADLQVVQKADDVLAGLSALGECSDIEAILHRSEQISPPDGEKQTQEVLAVRQQLDRAKVLYGSGKFKEGVAFAAHLVEEAQSIGYQPVEAEAIFWLGRLAEGAGEYDRSEANLLQAYRLATDCNHDELAALAATWSIFVVGNSMRRTREGLLWGRVAEVILRHLPGALALKGDWHNNLGAIEPDLKAAEAHLNKAQELRTSLYGANHSLVAQSVMNSATTHLLAKEYEQAEKLYLEAIEILKHTVGDVHPEPAVALNNLGVVYSKRNQFAKALQSHSEALSIREQCLGPDHPLTGQSHRNLGTVLRKMGRFDQAVWHNRRSLQILEASVGKDSTRYADDLENMGKTYLAMGKPLSAEEYFEQARAIVENEQGQKSPELAPYLLSEAGALVQLNQLRRAALTYQRILVLCRDTACPEDFLANASFGLARLLWQTPARRKEALDLAKQARDWYAAEIRWPEEGREVSDWLEAKLGR